MTAADVFETAVVLAALLYGLRLRYDDKAAIRRQASATAAADRKHKLNVAQMVNGDQS